MQQCLAGAACKYSHAQPQTIYFHPPTTSQPAGRAKDTIVLLSGKNIEPQPIEGALEQSPLIKHALLLGQDKRELGALIFPDEEALAASSSSSSSSAAGSVGLGDDDAALQRVLAAEVAKWNAARPDYHPEDKVGHIQVGRDDRICLSWLGAEQSRVVNLFCSDPTRGAYTYCSNYCSMRTTIVPSPHTALPAAVLHMSCCQVIRAPLSVESGTLTRTMKPRRPAIMQLYAAQVQTLLARLRG
jgi:long-subunit acyl-CoA synthetase (AMP-forming)